MNKQVFRILEKPTHVIAISSIAKGQPLRPDKV